MRSFIDPDAIRAMPQSKLDDYVWRRLRLEPPLDPPLELSHGHEPPEKILITAWRQDRDAAGFPDRLAGAIRASLRRAAAGRDDVLTDAVLGEQLASLGFLAARTASRAALPDLLDWVGQLWERIRTAAPEYAPIPEDLPELALLKPLDHLANAVSELSDGGALTPLWTEILAVSGDVGLRSVAWYGLSRSDPDGHLARLAEIVDDRYIHLPTMAWTLARHHPGMARLAQAKERLDPERRRRLRRALIEAGADPAMMQEFDRGVFPFPPAGRRGAVIGRLPRISPMRLNEAA